MKLVLHIIYASSLVNNKISEHDIYFKYTKRPKSNSPMFIIQLTNVFEITLKGLANLCR